jgi:transcriptional regulator with XRE-family HTH domain
MIRNTPKAMALGAKLRTARDAAGLSQRTLAKQLRIDQSVVSRNESGERAPNQDEVAAILDAIGMTGAERDEIIESARDTSGSPWQGTDLPEQPVQLAALLDIEQMTTDYVEWSPLIIPGLLQVSSYARAIMRAARVPDTEVGTRVAVRMGRKDILTRRNPTRCTALIGEAALRQMIGGPEVVGEQLDYLLSLSDSPNIEIRVVTTDTDWHPGLYGPFVLLTMDGGKSVVHLENARSAVFVPDEDDVAAYQDAVLELKGIALSPEQSTGLIRSEAERIARIDDSAVEEVDQERG